MAAIKISTNMNKLDRALRIIGSSQLIDIGFINTEILANPVINFLLGSFGLFNLISALAGFYPIYHLARISTQIHKN